MPIVRAYDSGLGRVQQAEPANVPLQNYSSEYNFGAGTNRALMHVADNLQDTSNLLTRTRVRLQEQYDRNDLLQMEAEYSRAINDLGTRLMTTQGRDSRDIVYQFHVEEAKIRSRISKKGYNERVLSNFELLAERDSGSAINKLSQHSAEQHRMDTLATSELAINTAINDGLDSGNLAGAEARISAIAAGLPMLPGEIEMKRQEYVSRLYVQAVQRKSVNDPQDAQNFYDLNKTKIDPMLHAQMEDGLKAKMLDFRAENIVEEVMRGGGSLEQLEERAMAGIPEADAETRNRVRTYLIREYNIREAKSEEGRRDRVKKLAGKVIEGKGFSGLTEEEMHWWMYEDPESFRSWESYAAAWNPKTGDVDTDPQTFYMLASMRTQDPDFFIDVDLMKFRPQLTQADFEKFVNDQMDMIKAESSGKPWKEPERLSFDKRIFEFIKDNDIKDETAGKYWSTMDQWYYDFQKENGGKKPEPDDITAALDRMKAIVVTPGMGKNRTAIENTFELSPYQMDRAIALEQAAGGDMTVESIQANYQSTIGTVQTLVDNGLVPYKSVDEIPLDALIYYQNKKKRDAEDAANAELRNM